MKALKVYLMESNEHSYRHDEAVLRLLGLETPLENEDIAGFIAQLPEHFDFVKDYENLKKFISANDLKNINPGELPIALMLYLKEKTLKIPSVTNNPVANIVIHQSVYGCLLTERYLSASELLLQLSKWIARLKKAVVKGD